MRSLLVKLSTALCVCAVASMAQTELLANGDFSQGEAGWVMGFPAGNGGAATGSVVDSNYVINISTAGYTKEYAVQLSDTGLTILNGHQYHFVIVAKASAQRPITYGVGMTNSPWSTYSGIDGVREMGGQLDTGFTTIDTSFTMSFPDDNGGARVFLNFGHDASWPNLDGTTVTIKSVSLKDVGGAKLRSPALKPSARPSLSLSRSGILLERITGSARLNVFDPRGKLVSDLTGRCADSPVISWNSTGLKSGTYIVRLYDNAGQIVRRATIAK